MLKDIDAVIFDLDGTIVDSMWLWRQVDIDYLKKHRLSMPEDLQAAIEGMSFSETAIYFKNRFCIEDSLEEIKSEWNKMANDYYMNRVPLKTGVLDFIKYLSAKDIPMGIGTSNSRELAETVLKKHDILKYFQTMRTSCEVEKGKPEPYIFLKVANDLGISPDRCIVFEDVPMGIMAGLNAGMRVCTLYDSFSEPVISHKRSLAHYYINNYNDILESTYEVLKK